MAPQAPANAADQQQPATTAQVPGQPANICQELVAFLRPKPPAPSPAAAPPAAPAPSAPAPGAPAPQARTGLTGGAPPQGASPPQTSGQPAQIAKAPSVAKPPPMPLEEGQALASANDLRGCQDATRRMRRAGVELPASLIALAALKPELLQAQQ